MKKTTKSCFSNGTDAEIWHENNCGGCIKGSADYAPLDKVRCSIERDIFIQWMGYGSEEINLKSYDATQCMECPHKRTEYPPRKPRAEKKDINQLELFKL